MAAVGTDERSMTKRLPHRKASRFERTATPFNSMERSIDAAEIGMPPA